jgi:AcrR family transcriptional regulator
MPAAKKRAAPTEPGVGLRERKKVETYDTIAATARQLFASRGYAGVTVAEIADVAGVSVKTLFKYFASKEDLFFEQREFDLRETLLGLVSRREPGQSPFDAMVAYLESLGTTKGTESYVASLEMFAEVVGETAPLLARMALMWERCEQAVAGALAAEQDAEPSDPRPRLVAAQLVALMRLYTTEPMRKLLRPSPGRARRLELEKTMRQTFDLVGDGVREYAKRSKR